jgi:mycofactocin precursor
MAENTTAPASAAGQANADQTEAGPLATDELLVEAVSIDGMCGVY